MEEKENLQSLIRAVLAIEILEHENKNFLSGDNRSRSIEKIKMLDEALNVANKVK